MQQVSLETFSFHFNTSFFKAQIIDAFMSDSSSNNTYPGFNRMATFSGKIDSKSPSLFFFSNVLLETCNDWSVVENAYKRLILAGNLLMFFLIQFNFFTKRFLGRGHGFVPLF